MNAQQPCGGCEKLREAARQVRQVWENQQGRIWEMCGTDNPRIAALAEAIAALAQPCQQPAAPVESLTVLADVITECADFIERNYKVAGIMGENYFRMADIVRNAKLVVELFKSNQLHTVTRGTFLDAKIAEQSAPVEAWRDLGPDEARQVGDSFIIGNLRHFMTELNKADFSQGNNWMNFFWQRRVTQGE